MFRRSPGFAFLFTALLALVPRLIDAQTTEPSSPSPNSRSLLEQLNRETQSLFKQVSPSIVRVQLPLPTNAGFAPEDPLSKWSTKLDPQAFARLEELQRRSPGTSFASAEIQPTTVPSQPGHVEIYLRLARFSPNGIGIVLDDQNHILVPRYVDREACQMPIPVAIGDGQWTSATFVASDYKAGLTILQLGKSKARPASISADIPPAGALLLVMSLNPASNRLAVWEGWEPDVSTLVNTDGTVAGFSEGGHFISAAACQPVANELIDHGYVRRPILGIMIETVAADDQQRQSDPVLGTTPALRIMQVFSGSVAERAGLQAGDLILKLGHQSVADASDFAAAIANCRGKTDIVVLRDDQRKTVSVDLQVQ
jgi:hypothetical protein